VRRVDGQRREHWEHALLEDRHQVLVVASIECRPVDELHSVRRQLAQQVVEHGLLVDDEAIGGGADLGELRLRRQSVVRRLRDAGRDLILQRGNAHLEELVEVRRADGTELEPLEQRHTGLFRQRQHTPVERQPTQFTVQQASRHATTLPSAPRFSG